MSERFFPAVAERAVFSAERMGKALVHRGEQLFVGLNAFEPGQAHALHHHAGVDKVYHVLEGQGSFQVGEEERRCTAGTTVIAPADVPHAVRNDGTERLVVLVVMAPPPGP